MAEITKVTTPMIPKENTSNKLKPITDQAFELTDPSKVHKADQDGKAAQRQSEEPNLLKESMGRPAIVPLLKNSGDMMQVLKKIALLVEMGVSASDAAKDVSSRELLESLFVSKEDFGKVLLEQDKASVLFKGEAFDILRDVQMKFSGSPKIRDAIANILKLFDYNVNSQNSLKSILYNCSNILDYMFSKDRAQFSQYLTDLANMVLPKEEAQAFIEGRTAPPQAPAQSDAPVQQQAPGELPVQAQNQTQGANQAQNTQQAQNQEQAQNAGETQQQGQTQASAQAQNPAQPQVPEELPAQAQAQGANQTQDTQQAQNQGQVQNTEGTQQQEQTQNTQQPQGQTQPLPERADVQEGQKPVNGEAYEQPEQQEAAGQRRQDSVRQPQDLPQLSPKEASGILKNNLLPLLSEIVTKYHQNEKIRDTIMVVVHNIVRVDQGTPAALDDAISKLAKELGEVANLPKNFEKQLQEIVKANLDDVKNTPNSVISKLSDVVSQTLTSPNANPAIVRQAENMLISLLQNQSTMMDVLHFVMPMQTPQGQIFTELYVDPETDEKVGKYKGKSHKVFLSVESEAHGSIELSFLETDAHVDFAMWCTDDLVKSLSGLKRQFSDIMQIHGYTMNNFNISEMRAQHSVAEVFPRLLEKKVGIDVQI